MLISVDTQKCLPCVRGKAYSIWADFHSLFSGEAGWGGEGCQSMTLWVERWGRMRNGRDTRVDEWGTAVEKVIFFLSSPWACCSWRTCIPTWPEVNLSLLTCSSRDGRSVWWLLYFPLKARVCASGLKYHIRKCQSVHQWLCLSSELLFPPLT